MDSKIPTAFMIVAVSTILLLTAKITMGFFASEGKLVNFISLFFGEALNVVVLSAVPLSLADYCRMAISKAGTGRIHTACRYILKFIKLVFGYLLFLLVFVGYFAFILILLRNHPEDLSSYLLHTYFADELLFMGTISTILFLFTLAGDRNANVSVPIMVMITIVTMVAAGGLIAYFIG